MDILPYDVVLDILSGAETAAVIEIARRAQSRIARIGVIFKVGDVEVTTQRVIRSDGPEISRARVIVLVLEEGGNSKGSETARDIRAHETAVL